MIRPSRVRTAAPRLAALVAILVAACGPSAPSSSVTPSAAAVASTSATTQPSVTAVPTASPAASTAVLRPSTMPRPADIPTDGSCEAPHSCLGLLAVGPHHTTTFKPGFGFNMPARGWENLSDEGGVFGLLPINSPGDTIVFFRDPKATTPEGDLILSVDSDVGAIAAWLPTNKALTVGPATKASIGGLKSVRMDIAAASSATPSVNCPVETCVAFFKAIDPAPVKTWQWDWGTVTSERQRLYLLTTADGSVIAIFVDSLDGTTFDTMTAAADTILATVKFDKS